MPLRAWVQPVGRRGIVARILVGVGDQRVADAAFVGRLVHQRVVEQAAADGWKPAAGRALHDVGMSCRMSPGDGVVGAALGASGSRSRSAGIVAVFRDADQR